MGKKKSRKARNASGGYDSDGDSSIQGGDEDPPCSHVKTKVTFTSVRNVLPHSAHACHTCEPRAAKNKRSQKSDFLVREQTQDGIVPDGLCVCLKCGFVGCDRMSSNHHAQAHSKQKRHPIMMHTGNLKCWCLECEREILPEQSYEVDKCRAFISKHFDHHKATDDEEAAPEPKSLRDLHYSASLHSSKVDIRQMTAAKGLSNLGNTCFFNAVMQCVSRTVPLREALARTVTQQQVNTVTVLPTLAEKTDPPMAPLDVTLTKPVGSLTLCLHKFMQIMHDESTRSAVNPRELLQEVVRRSPRFRGYQQQDSQEFLRALLDHLELDQKLRIQDAIVAHFGGPAAATRDCQARFIKDQPEEQQDVIKAYLKSATTFVDRVFGGRLCSTVVCQACHNVTRTLEPCLDLSVSIADPVKKRSATLSQFSKQSKDRLPIPKPGNSGSNTSTLSKKQLRQQAKEARREAKRQAKLAKQARQEGASDADDDLTSACPSDATSIASDVASVSSGVSMQTASDVGSRGHSRTASGASLRHHSRSSSLTNGVWEGITDAHGVDITVGMADMQLGGDGTEADPEADVGTGTDAAARAGSDSEFTVKLLPPIVPGTVVPPYQPKRGECSVQSCLTAFCVEEFLEGDNLFSCEHCGKLSRQASGDEGEVSDGGEGTAAGSDPPAIKRPATKQLLIEQPPRVLTLHLKRFEQHGWHLQKVAKQVTFPLVLDLAPFCSKNVALSVYAEGDAGVRYSLFGIVEHQGRLHSGHYICYVKDTADPDPDADAKWYCISDSQVRQCSQSDVLKAQAYLLFYERVH